MTNDDNSRPPESPKPRNRIMWAAVPAVVFAAVAALFVFALQSGDPSRLPSAFIGKPAPSLTLGTLDGLSEGRAIPAFQDADLQAGKVSVVNFWASWCGPCILEHPLLVELKDKTGADLYGINYKDKPENAVRFLGRYGNPYKAIGTDAGGRNGIEWGVYGTPETFVLNGKGQIVYKHVGPISEETLSSKVIPAIEKAQEMAAASK